MPMTSLPTWIDEWHALPLDPVGSDYPLTIANFVKKQTKSLQLDASAGGLSGPWTWDATVFETTIRGLTPKETANPGASAFASAFEESVLSSTLSAQPGSYVGAPTPATLFSVVSSTIESGVVSSARSVLFNKLLAAPPADVGESIYPIALRAAFASITYELSGLNSLPIPLPLIGSGFPVV